MNTPPSENTAQYSDSRRLAARARLHTQYTIADIGWFPWVASNLALPPGAKILDVGCGPGWFWASTTSSLPPALDLTLSDLSAGMVQEALRRCGALPLAALAGLRADATALPIASETMDAVLAMHMLYHLPDPALGLAEAWRVLKPGGTLAVTTNGAGNLRQLHALATTFGGSPTDPATASFGYDHASSLMKAQFGNVSMTPHPARMRVTNPDDVILALTSFPPGDTATPAQLAALHDAVLAAFQAGKGELEVERHSALFISHKPSAP
jgi:ubiquinone/menaquinone biosynthesis C-methylase UbiE